MPINVHGVVNSVRCTEFLQPIYRSIEIVVGRLRLTAATNHCAAIASAPTEFNTPIYVG